MGKRRTLGQRVIEYFMTAPIAEIDNAVDIAKVIVEARKAGHDQIAWPAPKPKAARKPRAKKTATSTISNAVVGEKVQ